MPLSDAELQQLIRLLIPVFQDSGTRRYLIGMAFPSDLNRRSAIALDSPPRQFAFEMVDYYYQRAPSDLITVLHVVQEEQGGDLARALQPFVDKLAQSVSQAYTPPAPSAAEQPTYKLFISYRRKSWELTKHLAADLRQHMNADVFVDFSGIDEADFDRSILRHLAESDCVLVIVTEHTFSERIHQPDDWVRREISEALRLGKPILLVSREGQLPPANLPDDIRSIGGKQAVTFYPEHWDSALKRLSELIPKAIQHAKDAPLPTSAPAAALPAAADALEEEALSLSHSDQKADLERAETLLASLSPSTVVRIAQRAVVKKLADIHAAEAAATHQQASAERAYRKLEQLIPLITTPESLSETQAALRQFKRDYPQHGDPHGIARQLTALKRRFKSAAEPAPPPTLSAASAPRAADSDILEHAHHLIQQSAYTEAFALLQTFVNEHPDHTEAWFLLAHVVDTPAQMAEALRHVLHLQPNHAEAQGVYAQLMREFPELATPESAEAFAPTYAEQDTFSASFAQLFSPYLGAPPKPSAAPQEDYGDFGALFRTGSTESSSSTEADDPFRALFRAGFGTPPDDDE
ncbi:TIR domain-containing protein [Chloroflexi bacterium CFX3]|nr:TIR domain-containing protein [Chloroflexi bacterium CFX3]